MEARESLKVSAPAACGPSAHEASDILVSFVMPCYNSASYMARGIDSILAVSQDFPCEILLVNDGSSDATGEVARDYERRFAQVRAIDQENANWGGVVNHGIALARGRYFKVLDSDDRFDPVALRRVLETLQRTVAQGEAPDLLITNYAYDHMASKSLRVMQYRKFFPKDRLFTWSEMGRPGLDKFIMIHAAWYRTEILRESGVELPTKVSYMDSHLLLHPMPYTSTLYYLDEAPYLYLIGREGQSVEIDVVKKHIDEQIMASMLAIDDVDYAALYEGKPNCAMLMTGYVSCMMSVSTIHLFMIGTPEALDKNAQLWEHLRTRNPELHARVRRSWAGRSNRRTALGRRLALLGFGIAQRIYKFA